MLYILILKKEIILESNDKSHDLILKLLFLYRNKIFKALEISTDVIVLHVVMWFR